jgi:hypothetical protein
MIHRVFWFATGALLLSALVFAQTFGEITGVVTDASSGAVVNAVGL